MAWETPIYDRTLADAAYAKLHQGSTENLKGALNISDLNRIERNTVYLHNVLAGYGYIVDIETHGDWTIRDLFYLTDMDRIRQNVINIVDGFSVLGTTPTIDLGNYYLTVTDVNDIEKILLDVDTLLQSLVLVLHRAGQPLFFAGHGVYPASPGEPLLTEDSQELLTESGEEILYY